MKKTKFKHVLVLANGSRKAHELAKKCRVDCRNFHYVKDPSTINSFSSLNVIFLEDDSFCKHKNYNEIKSELAKIKGALILDENSFNSCVHYE